jgi:hypothetical protein
MRQRNRAYESYRQPSSHAQSVNPPCDLTLRSGNTAEGAPTARKATNLERHRDPEDGLLRSHRGCG